MNQLYSDPTTRPAYAHLDALENQSLFLIREVFYLYANPAILWSMGKDSSVLLWLIKKAFFGEVPFPCIHIDTQYKIDGMIAFRDRIASDWNLDLRVYTNKDAIQEKQTFPSGNLSRQACCKALKTDVLRTLIAQESFDAIFVGIRRDEENTRAVERYISPRDQQTNWNTKNQPAEFWNYFYQNKKPNTHVRVHPLLHWTEINIWEYIDREHIPVIPEYFSKNGARYRSLGCYPCTSTLTSNAATLPEIIAELKTTQISERSLRAQDQESEAAFEMLRKAGYM